MEGNKKENSDAEDVPSDFFDDFNKEEFIEGLSVIDSWDDGDGKKRAPRGLAEAVDSVKDLRELIGDSKEEPRSGGKRDRPDDSQQQSSSRDHLDEYIKPGSRRDISKTNEAIKRDKAVKVKEYIAKHLEDDLRPPGTELDDYYDDTKAMDSKKPEADPPPREVRKSSRGREKERRESPERHRKRSARRSPRRSPRRSSLKREPLPPRPNILPISPDRYQNRWSTYQPRRHYVRQFSPMRSRRSPLRRSPLRRSPLKRSPLRRSPRPRYDRRSRSPYQRSRARRSRTRSRSRSRSREYRRSPHYQPPLDMFPPGPEPYPGPPSEYHGGPPYQYPQNPPYGGGPMMVYGAPAPYPDFVPPPGPMPMAVPQPVPAPIMDPSMNPIPPSTLVPVEHSAIPGPVTPVAAPALVSPSIPPMNSNKIDEANDPLAKLVAEGKLSREDYLKLAPNKSSCTTAEAQFRGDVLNRCQSALTKLGNIRVPARLLINSAMIGPEVKALPPPYCSPLKRTLPVEFHFTKPNGASTNQHNKQLLDCIITTMGLDSVISKPKKKVPKETKDAGCQTTRPHCDVCEIRESTQSFEVSTFTEPEYFTSSVHTQVVEHELYSSKAVFNPSGSISGGATISIAHMTPAQLVSQLAARAKTLKQTDPPPSDFMRRPPNNYDYDGRGGGSQQYQGYNNYRY